MVFFAALFCCTLWSFLLHFTARYMIYTKKKGKRPLVKSLPPTDKNLLLQMRRAHCQALMWKAADKQNARSLCITEFGWEWLNNVPSPVRASGPPAPPDLMKIVSAGLQGRLAHKQTAFVWQQVCPVQHTVSAKVPLISVTIQWQPNMGTVQLYSSC